MCLILILKKNIINFTRMILMVLYLFIISTLIHSLTEIKFSLQVELLTFVKIFFPFIVLCFLLHFKDSIDETRFIKLLSMYGVAAALSIILLSFTGIGISSYGGADESFGIGTKGLFTAGNDIGLSLLMTNCVLSYLYIKERKIIYFMGFIIVTIGTIMLGTMAGIGGSIIIILLFFFAYLKYTPNISIFARMFYLFLSVGLSVFIVSTIVKIFSEDPYFLQRLEILLSGNSRGVLEQNAKELVSGFNFIQCLFGRGYTGFASDMAESMMFEGYRLTEMDFYDIYGYYGLIVGGFIIMFSFYILVKYISLYFRTKGLLYFWCAMIMCFFIGHGYLAGHAYTSTQSAVIYVGIAFMVLKNDANLGTFGIK